ncbi:MAG: phage portal protein [Candidatus Poribacteria bacterium]|nr:phage portal protein [Candidatus Poribacteria bacterium]
MFGFGKTEKRSADYTDEVVSAILAKAQAQNAQADSLALAAAETCRGLWIRGLLAASISGPDAVSRELLALIGCGLFRRGEFVGYLESDGANVTIHPCSEWTVTGGYDPDTWKYRVTLPGPSETTSINGASPLRIVHIKINADPNTPWRGHGPLRSGSLTSDLAARIERQLDSEFSRGFGRILSASTDPDNSQEWKEQIKTMRGGMIIAEVTGGKNPAYGNPSIEDYKQIRFGADPTTQHLELRSQLQRDIIAACGVPVELVSRSDGAAMRESWRRFVISTIRPMGQLIADTLTARIGPVELDYSTLRGSDVQGLGRAYKALIDSGMSESEAANVVGI